jgi:hypothetical protein
LEPISSAVNPRTLTGRTQPEKELGSIPSE